MGKQFKIETPDGSTSVLLHSCCAPCSTAIVECLINNGITPTIYFFNPNIYPKGEYELRKNENKRYASLLGLDFIDVDYDHNKWLGGVCELGHEPEGGIRCLECFKIRLIKTAEYALNHGFSVYTTTLATSRWKNLEQINQAGHHAELRYPDVKFWARNWRKNGLSERKRELIKSYSFYQQQYCGCEYSLRDSNKWRESRNWPLIKTTGH